MKNRIDLARYFAELGFNFGAEIGVYKGIYSEILCQLNPDLRLLCVDNWESSRRRGVLDETKQRLAPYKTLIIWNTSLEAAEFVPDGSLDFVFIDAAHDYENVKKDINVWVPKVRQGGIVSGHDYYDFPSGRGGVIQAVDEYVRENSLQDLLQIIPWDKENPMKDFRQPCWWFIK